VGVFSLLVGYGVTVVQEQGAGGETNEGAHEVATGRRGEQCANEAVKAI
jgi:hypothetical protein